MMWLELKRVFRRLSAAEVAAAELHQAELSLLEAQSLREWSAAQVQYHEQRIDRLRGVVGTPQSLAADARRELGSIRDLLSEGSA